jgi:hypothetical protein
MFVNSTRRSALVESVPSPGRLFDTELVGRTECCVKETLIVSLGIRSTWTGGKSERKEVLHFGLKHLGVVTALCTASTREDLDGLEL